MPSGVRMSGELEPGEPTALSGASQWRMVCHSLSEWLVSLLRSIQEEPAAVRSQSFLTKGSNSGEAGLWCLARKWEKWLESMAGN